MATRRQGNSKQSARAREEMVQAMMGGLVNEHTSMGERHMMHQMMGEYADMAMSEDYGAIGDNDPYLRQQQQRIPYKGVLGLFFVVVLVLLYFYY